MRCMKCFKRFDKETNWGYAKYPVCPLCAVMMTDRDWDKLMDESEEADDESES